MIRVSNRQSFISVFGLVFFTLSSLLFVETESFAETFVEGQHYKVLNTPGAVDDPSKIEVREFFWYGCGHCYKFEAYLNPWKKGLADDVNVVLTPGLAAPHWKLLGSGYYAAKNLGIDKQSHKALFDAIHKDKRSMVTADQLASFYSAYGVTEDAFKDQLNSFSVKTSTRKAEQLFRQYGLTGVPAVVVNGKYQAVAKNFQEMIQVIDFLVEKERRALASSKK